VSILEREREEWREERVEDVHISPPSVDLLPALQSQTLLCLTQARGCLQERAKEGREGELELNDGR